MQNILVIGTSVTYTRNIARDIIEARGEDVVRIDKKMFDVFGTEKADYTIMPLYAVNALNLKGKEFDEIHITNGILVKQLDEITPLLKEALKEGAVQHHEVFDN